MRFFAQVENLGQEGGKRSARRESQNNDEGILNLHQLANIARQKKNLC